MSKTKEVATENKKDLSLSSLEEEAKKELPERELHMMRLISFRIAKNGMTAEEACYLEGIDYDFINGLITKYPIISKIIRVKELEFKSKLLRNVANKAFSGDDKLAQWLLEKRYPEEYGSNKNRPRDPEESDLVATAINFVQESGDNTPLVNRKSVSAITIKRSIKSPVTPPLSDIDRLRRFLV